MEQDHETIPAGASAADPAEEAARQDPLVQQATDYLRPVVQTLFNGIMLSSAQWCPADKMIATLCHSIGVAIGNATSAGGLPAALKIRHVCQEAFLAGVRSVKVQPPPATPPPLDVRAALNGTSGLHPATMKGQIRRG
jgi:hypothetical protein